MWGGDFDAETLQTCCYWNDGPHCGISIRNPSEGEEPPPPLRFFGVPHPRDESPHARLHKCLTAGLAGILALLVVAGTGSWLIRVAIGAILAMAAPIWTLLAESLLSQHWDRKFPNFQFESTIAIAAETAVWGMVIFGLMIPVASFLQAARPLRFGSPANGKPLSISALILFGGIVALFCLALSKLIACHPGTDRTLRLMLFAAQTGAQQGQFHLLFYAWIQIPLIGAAIWLGLRYAKPTLGFFAFVLGLTFVLCFSQHRLADSSQFFLLESAVSMLIEFLFIAVAIGTLQALGWLRLKENNDGSEGVWEGAPWKPEIYPPGFMGSPPRGQSQEAPSYEV